MTSALFPCVSKTFCSACFPNLGLGGELLLARNSAHVNIFLLKDKRFKNRGKVTA